MMRASLILYRILIGSVIILSGSCQVYKDVVVHEVTGVEMVEYGEGGLNLRVLLDIENPNWYTVRLTESEVKIYLEGKEFGDLTLLETMEIPKKARSVQPMYMKVSMSDLERLLGDLFALLFKQEYSISGLGYVKGKVMFAARKVDVSFQKTIPRSELGF